MKHLFVILLSCILLISCNKDKFNTKPTLKLKSVNDNTISRNEDLIMNLTVTDAEGDLTDSITVIKKVRNCSQGSRIDKYKLPVFPITKNLNVDIAVGFSYSIAGTYPGLSGPLCVNRNDSLKYQFVIKDAAGNLSDTVSTNEIVVLQ
jgi:hypothetical protein